MPIYHFDIVDGFKLEDPIGLECENNSAACARSDLIAERIAHDVPASEARSVVVSDDDGTEIYAVAIRAKAGEA